ncbi:EVI5-like protein isoform X2 [Babylonia areolata]|uniref:EVI5-like protein isoform X2 n=1 Tax=Babylonia areolata TaxID=304850 RepID=UPI003FD4D853
MDIAADGVREEENGEGEGRVGGNPVSNLCDEELRLLAKLEEANRKLEMDQKSCPTLVTGTANSAQPATSPAHPTAASPSHSRKGSEASVVSSNSSTSQFSNQLSYDGDEASITSDTLWEVWGRIVNDWDSVKKKTAYLKDLVRKGIPHEFRGIAWQLLLGVHDSPSKKLYADYMKKTSPCEKLIRRDIARTFPDHDFFKEKDGFGQESLFNVMKAYSLHDREVGYCQGSGFIVGLLLMEMPEEDAFAVLVRLMQEYRLRELFKPSMAELGLCMFKLEFLLQELLPTLHVHFQTQNFDTSMYASSWFLTLFTTSMPLSLARRVMDLFVSEGMESVLRIALAILQTCQEDLLALDMEGLLQYLQKDLRSRFDNETDQDLLLQVAYQVRYNSKKLKRLEKDYSVLKSKENEDQIELRRLRTENRLLRQRIDNLEKESASLADKLVQDQVTRAQEAEECYALKNELSVTRHQLKETQRRLEDAQDIIGDIKKRTNIIQGTVHLSEEEETHLVQHLQEELIAVRLREAETITHIKELNTKIGELEDTNLQLQRAPSNDVQHLQEELIAVKLREAEANLSLKELRQKVTEIETYWQSHMERMATEPWPKEKSWKAEVRHLQEEVMTCKVREARSLADLKDTRHKVMELETQNHICQNQIRRMKEENKSLQQRLEEAAERERELKSNLTDISRKLDDTESKHKEDAVMSRIKEAENVQLIAELRRKLAEIDIQREEMLTADQLQDSGHREELERRLCHLQEEVAHLQMAAPGSNTSSEMMTSSILTLHDSDEEWDTENLNRTLSDIIEGKSPLTRPSNPIPRFSSLDDSGDFTEGLGPSPEPSADGGVLGKDQDIGCEDVFVTEGDEGGAGHTDGAHMSSHCSAGQAPVDVNGAGDVTSSSGNPPHPDVDHASTNGSLSTAPSPAPETDADCDENFNKATVSGSRASHISQSSSNGRCSVAAAMDGGKDGKLHPDS